MPPGSKAIIWNFYVVSQEVLRVFKMTSTGIGVVQLAVILIEFWLNKDQVIEDYPIAIK